MLREVLALGAVVASAGAANAAYISFASDSNPALPTFVGGPGTLVGGVLLEDGSGPAAAGVPVTLLVDLDEDGPGGPLAVDTIFSGGIGLNAYQQVTIPGPGGGVLHTYRASGLYSFTDLSGNVLLNVSFQNAIFTSWSNLGNQWGTSATIQGNEASDGALTFTFGSTGVFAPFAAGVITEEDFAFTLTNITAATGSGRVLVNPGNGAITSTFAAEGSYSASFIPAPGALALLGLGAVAARRRRS